MPWLEKKKNKTYSYVYNMTKNGYNENREEKEEMRGFLNQVLYRRFPLPAVAPTLELIGKKPDAKLRLLTLHGRSFEKKNKPGCYHVR